MQLAGRKHGHAHALLLHRVTPPTLHPPPHCHDSRVILWVGVCCGLNCVLLKVILHKCVLLAGGGGAHGLGSGGYGGTGDGEG